MPSVVEIGKGSERDRNNKRNERREIDGSTTSNLHEEVETTQGDDQAGTEMEAERRKQRKNKSENELRGVKKENMERQELNEGKEIMEKRKRKMESENDGKEEDVSNGTSGHMSTPTRRWSQRIAEAITMRNNRDSKVTYYEELDTSLIKYLGKW